jgi:hypothetical protein
MQEQRITTDSTDSIPFRMGSKGYVGSHHKFLDVLYEVEPLDDTAPVHLTSYLLPYHSNMEPGTRVIEALNAHAFAYWRGDPSPYMEVLIGAPVRVVKRLDWRAGDP